MRVAVVHSFYRSGQPSGENVAVEQQIGALGRAGIEVVPLFRHTDNEIERSMYPMTSALKVSTGWDGGHLDKVVNQIQPDIVHVHNTFPNFGTRWLTKVDAPVVLTLHNFRLSCANGLHFRNNQICLDCPTHGSTQAVRHACFQDSRLASLPIAIATAGGPKRNRVLAASSVTITQCRRVHRFMLDSGIAGDSLAYVPGFVERRSKGAAPVPHTPHFAFAGRTSPEKGLGELTRLWPADMPLDVFGGAPGPDCEAHENIAFRGRLDRDQLMMRLSRYTALIFPGLVWEGAYPLVVREALEAGLPVVARDGSSASDLVYESGAGVVYRGGDGESLRDALVQVSRHNSEFRIAARRFFEEALTEDRWSALVTEVYQRAIALTRADP